LESSLSRRASSLFAAWSAPRLSCHSRCKPACDQSVLGIDGAIAALGTARLVAGPLDTKAPLLERGLSVAPEAFAAASVAASFAGSSAAMKALVTALSIWTPTLRQ
jgi:hypothetical protein